MRKPKLLSFSLAAFLATSVWAGQVVDNKLDKLVFPTITVYPLGTAFGEVVYKNLGDPISSFQFDLHYDTRAFKITPSLGPVGTLLGKMLTFHALRDGTLRVMVAGLDQTLIQDEGVIVDLSVEIKKNASPQPGNYKLDVSNFVGTTLDAIRLPVSAKNGLIVFATNPDTN